MRSLIWVLIALSAVGFLLAVIGVYSYGLIGVTAEGFSRGCSNLALLAIALMLATKKKPERD
jgi:O-antigen/teichoic acid export membrane protein